MSSTINNNNMTDVRFDSGSTALNKRQSSDISSTTPPRRSTSVKSAQLRGNLMREHLDRDPLFYYETVGQVLGLGSMGGVVKVRKRSAIIGGSARKEVQAHIQHEKRLQQCFGLPVVGGVFQYLFKDQLDKQTDELKHSKDNSSSISSNQATVGSSINNSNSNNNNNQMDYSITGSNNAILLSDRSNNSQKQQQQHHESIRSVNSTNSNGSSSTTTTNKEIVYAMKSIHLSRVTDEKYIQELKNEIHILRTLDHPHIVRAIETFEHRNQIFIIMELLSGGDLYSRDPYTEPEAARIVSSILSAVSYMHDKDICHRDLKYENVMFTSNSPTAEIKLIDFGLSAKFGNEELTEGVGTIYTMAPEVLLGKYTKQADIWSVGVLAFMLLSSQMPFYGRNRKDIVDRIQKGKYEFRGRRWKKVSEQAKEFVRDLLVSDPDDRATADEAFSSSWLNKRFSATVRGPLDDECDSAKESLVKYANYSKLKKVALMVVAHKATTEEIGILRKVFQKYDVQRDGCLSYTEFKLAMQDAGFSEEDYRNIFDAVDMDGSGVIRYTEFLAATIEAHGAISEERLAEAFDRIDADDSGYISRENLKELLGNEFPSSEIDDIFKETKMTKDGLISYSDFLALWQNQHEGMRQEAMEEITMLVDGSSDSVDSNMKDTEIVSRSNFINQKMQSDRKIPTILSIAESTAVVTDPNFAKQLSEKKLVSR